MLPGISSTVVPGGALLTIAIQVTVDNIMLTSSIKLCSGSPNSTQVPMSS